MLISCAPSPPEGAPQASRSAKPSAPKKPIAKDAKADPKAKALVTPASASEKDTKIEGPTAPWTVTVRGDEVLLNRPECAVSFRLDPRRTSLSIRAACTARNAPKTRDVSAALAALFVAHPDAKTRLKGMWTGKMAALGDGRWERALGAAALSDPRWKSRTQRVAGDPTENTVYVSLVNGSDAILPLRQAFAPHGFDLELSRVEKVFTRPASAFGLKNVGGDRQLPFDGGIHTFKLTRSKL